MTVTVRPAEPLDRAAILGVVWDAFTRSDRLGTDEIEVVTSTWAADAVAPGLELVAVAGTDVVGHVMAGIGDHDGSPVIGIAPLAVVPAHQRQGVGSALMQEVLRRADTAGWPFVVLLGDPGYYERFGFEPAGELGIHYAAVGSHNPHFMLRRLGAYEVPSGCNYRYCWEL
jgi:predicted N-acetyltransferase YhbS